MTDRNAPRVSVLMSVRDVMPWLEGAIATIKRLRAAVARMQRDQGRSE